MAERKRGSPSVWRFLVSLSLAAAAALVAPGAALADATIGQAAGIGGCGFNGGTDTVQTDSTGVSYTLPGAGSITSWSTLAAAPGTFDVDPTLRFELWRPNAGSTYALVGVGEAQTVPQDGATHAFALAQPIQGQAGDLLGLWFSGPAMCAQFTGVWTNIYASAADSAPTQGQLTTLDVTRTGWQLNVAANFAAGPSFVVPTSADQCKDRGWGELTDDTGTPFKNQGDCVSFVATGGKNPAA